MDPSNHDSLSLFDVTQQQIQPRNGKKLRTIQPQNCFAGSYKESVPHEQHHYPPF